MANYKAMAERARKSAAAAKADGARTAGLFGGALLVGLMVKSGAVARLPDIGVPKTVVLGGVGKAIGYNVSGPMGQVANGVGDASLVIGIFQFTQGMTVSGSVAGDNASGNNLDRERKLASQLRAATERRLNGGGGGVQEDVADLEALAEALPDAAE